MKEKPKVIIKPNNAFYSYKQVVQLCSNYFHDHQSYDICLENGIYKCGNSNGQELGEYGRNSNNEFKELLSRV